MSTQDFMAKLLKSLGLDQAAADQAVGGIEKAIGNLDQPGAAEQLARAMLGSDLYDSVSADFAPIDSNIAAAGKPWAAQVTSADRWAADIVNRIFKDRPVADHGQRLLSEHPLHTEIRTCSDAHSGCLLAAVLATAYCHDWAAAIGAGGSTHEFAYDPHPLFDQLLKYLLRRSFEHTEVHQRVLLHCLCQRHSGIGGTWNRLPGLLERVMTWADRNPGLHADLWRQVDVCISGCELADMSPKLGKYFGAEKLPMLPPLIACAHALIRHETARRAARDFPHNEPHFASKSHGYWIREDGYFGGISGWGASNDDLHFTFESPSCRDLIDPTTHTAPSIGDLEALARLMRDVPPSPIAAELANLVLCIARQLGVESRSSIYADLQEMAGRNSAWEIDRIVASKCAQTRLEEELGAQWPQQTPALLAHLDQAAGSKPSAKWLKELKRIVSAEMAAALAIQFAAFAANGWASRRFYDPQEARLKGLLWATSICPPDIVAGPIARFAQIACFQKISGLGIRSEANGNACLWTLINLPDGTGVPHLSRLLARVTFPKTKKLIEAALNEAAENAGVTRGALDEMSVPTHDLNGNGRCEIAVGAGAALIAIDGTASVALTWRTPDGKVTKALPEALKPLKDEIKLVKAQVKEIEADLSVQPWRVQRIWLDDRRWETQHWRRHYVEHPLMGELSRRLIWNIHTSDGRVAGTWQGGVLIGLDGRALPLDGATISLWHPIGCEVAEVLAWRARLSDLGIVQPFKQAHREVYIVTDAERRTDVYSNRFAGHIIKQHQMQALARLNGWAMTVHVGYDGGMGKYPSRIAVPQAGLIAEYYLEGSGSDNDYSPGGGYLYLASDQLRFVRPTNMSTATRALGSMRDLPGEPVRMVDVPPLLFTEIMRHCDLFVGVASIANDPNWIDSGADLGRNRWRTDADAYWRNQSFGEVDAAGETRRTLLMTLLPSLAIGKVARVEGKFLRVEGKRRVYKIHLGSGNILMEPNDQYLCIVPKREPVAKSSLHLPFEGDNVLSIILSKAALLAADDKITDPMIVSQMSR
jgi:hypothetical protein